MRAAAVGLLLLSLTLVGLTMAWQRNRVTALGYGIRRLEIQHDQIRERRRELEIEIASLSTPAAVQGRLHAFGIELVQPATLKQLAAEDAKPQPGTNANQNEASAARP